MVANLFRLSTFVPPVHVYNAVGLHLDHSRVEVNGLFRPIVRGFSSMPLVYGFGSLLDNFRVEVEAC